MVMAIVVAGGQGRRFGQKKQFLKLKNKPALVWSLEKLGKINLVDKIVLVLPAEDLQRGTILIKKYRLKKIAKIVSGGRERQDSVWAGLTALEKTNGSDLILVHDGVRPLVKEENIYALIKTAQRWGGAVLGVPVKDTLKEVSKEVVVRTLSRDKIWAIQTPQAFRYDWLKKAYLQARKSGFAGTDDAQLVEKYGKKVRLVAGDETNIKITTPADLKYAEILI